MRPAPLRLAAIGLALAVGLMPLPLRPQQVGSTEAAQEEPEPQQSEPEENGPDRSDPDILGSAAAFSLTEEPARLVQVEAGMPMFELPDETSKRLTMIDTPIELEVLEDYDVWKRVRYNGRTGWVWPDLPTGRRGIDISHELSMIPVSTPGIDTERLRRLTLAQEAMGLAAPNRQLGPYSALTNVDSRPLLEHLDRIAANLAESYRLRYGLEPSPPEDQTVALFATEAQYRSYEAAATDFTGSDARGHAGAGLAALYLEKQGFSEAGFLLVHELTHLMNRSALGPDPPPWIEEGIANDLAYSRIDKQGRLRLGSFNGDRAVVSGQLGRTAAVNYTAGLAALMQMLRLRQSRRGTPLSELVDFDKERFLDPDRRGQYYTESTFLVRFLIEGDKRRYADGFRRYLDAVNRGEAADAGTLIGLLGTEWKKIEIGLDAWLDLQSANLLR